MCQNASFLERMNSSMALYSRGTAIYTSETLNLIFFWQKRFFFYNSQSFVFLSQIKYELSLAHISVSHLVYVAWHTDVHGILLFLKYMVVSARTLPSRKSKIFSRFPSYLGTLHYLFIRNVYAEHKKSLSLEMRPKYCGTSVVL